MTPRLSLAATLTLGSALILAIPPARAQSCDQLWYQRNAIYKQGGYCFRTPRAISAFGNAGCQYDSEYDVPLSANQRRIVSDIQAQERAFGCRP